MALPPPAGPGRPAPKSAAASRGVRVRYSWPQRRWLRWTAIALGSMAIVGVLGGTYLWISYGHMIDERLNLESQPIPRIFGRPFEIQPGRPLSQAQLVQRLNDVGYAQRPKATLPGEFSLTPGSVLLVTRPTGKEEPRIIKVDFTADR